MASMRLALVAAAAWAAGALAEDVQCPGSPAMVHASAQVTVSVPGAGCSEVMAEMKARVAGQPSKWHDPHNNGVYKILETDSDKVTLSRTTGNGQYTDKLMFTFVGDGGSCELLGCSESQVFSVADFGTNYCNLRMLYCGSEAGCKPVQHDFGFEEVSVKHSLGAGQDPSKCLVTNSAPASS
mmetsp:Transcript_3427/g.9640  ORF Transcript_3427/g.9640 Transcript_3427/m.9640 type:complete len:182 (+) Transcript_3427:56-601(+)